MRWHNYLRVVVLLFGVLLSSNRASSKGVSVGGSKNNQNRSNDSTVQSDPDSFDTKIYAIYFPQFHKDRVNDKLWGDGFTEWDNLRMAPDKNRLGQPIARPTELGHYNLLEYDIRKKQRQLAREYGIDGFIYHHYWFHHRNEGAVLSRALERMLQDSEPNLPFALNWAKESFVTTWNAQYNESSRLQTSAGRTVATTATTKANTILWRQEIPTSKDHLIVEHYTYLRQYFWHRNYIRIQGAPLFTIYGSDSSTAPVLEVIRRLKQLAIADGFPAPGLHIPQMRMMTSHPLYKKDKHVSKIESPLTRYFDSVVYYPYADSFIRQMKIPQQCITGKAHEHAKNKKFDEVSATVGVLTTFDNTPRRSIQDARIFNRNFTKGLTPQKSLEIDIVTAILYERCCSKKNWKKATINIMNAVGNGSTNTSSRAADNNVGSFVLLNAWNEWGEGMMLEPNSVYGTTMLEAVRAAKYIARLYAPAPTTAAAAAVAAGGAVGGGGTSQQGALSGHALAACRWNAYTKYLARNGLVH